MKKILGLTKKIVLKLWFIALVAGVLPLQATMAGEGVNDCSLAALGFKMPGIEFETLVPTQAGEMGSFNSAEMNLGAQDQLVTSSGIEFELAHLGGVDEDCAYAKSEDHDHFKTEASEYEPASLKKGDILKAVPSITTKDDKTLGILVPPFAYFSKKF